MSGIFVVGSFVVGVTIRVPRVPVLGESLVGDSFDLGPGGKGTNQAIAAARLGAQVDLLACVGDDIFADMAARVYEREQISMTHVHRIPDVNTAVGCVTLLPSGENWIVVDLGANMCMTVNHVDAAQECIATSDIVMTQLEVPPQVVARAMELGRANGAMTILNPAPARPVAPDVLANVDLLTPNETETRILLGRPPDDPTPTSQLARQLLDSGVGQVVVTRGQHGALIVTRDGVVEIPAVQVQAVDVTGAGDSFNAALAVGLSEGLGLEDAVYRASYAGAYTVTRLGVIDGLPMRTELAAFRAQVEN